MAVIRALRGSHDCIVSNHRNHGHFLTYSGEFLGLVAEVMGREAGVCGGRGGSQHLAWRRFHSNGVQAGMSAIAAGHALATKLRDQNAVVAAMIGDGTLGQGLVYEVLNLASILRVPLLVVVENNSIAQTTPTSLTTGGSIAGRANAFGLSYWSLADNQPDFFQLAEDIVAEVRCAGRPGLLEIETMRLGPHSKGDDARPAEELSLIEARDPLNQLGTTLESSIRHSIEARNSAFIQEVLESAQASPEARFERVPRSVFSTATSHHGPPPPSQPANNVRTSIHLALKGMLEERPDVILLGEDLHAPYGGAFKVTGNLSEVFPGRVLSMPISEAAIVGAGIGLALEGLRPVVEIMFADFTTLAFDQLYNHAVKFSSLSSHSQVPLVVRTPAGGRRGYGPTHSQSPEHFLTSVPGLTVIMPSHHHDAGALLRRAVLDWPHPTVFLEHKLLYATPQEPDSWRQLTPSTDDPASHLFPTLVSGPEDPDLTIVSFGGMAPHVEDAARHLREEEELAVEIVLPSLLSPLPRVCLVSHLLGRPRILLAEESHVEFGVSAEIAAMLAENRFSGRLARIGTPPIPIPSARSLEIQVIPDWRAVVSFALRLFEE
jgi:2-oxoisovalerate dehydrogenase E1 component